MTRTSTPRFLICLLFFVQSLAFAQQPSVSNGWQSQKKVLPSFIKNEGQFQSTLSKNAILYAHDGSQTDLYFSKSSVVVEFTLKEKRKKSDDEKKSRAERKKRGFKNAEEWRAFEEEGLRMHIEKDAISLQWLGANPNAQIVMENMDEFYHSYSFFKNGEMVHVNRIPSWKKLVYKNLYDHIDVVYEIHPVSGFKYSLILHPGADISKVKLQYSKEGQLQADGSIHTATRFGNMIDHAPVSFYEQDKNKVINSYYQVNGNIISFALGNYDQSQTVVFDPWTQAPNFINTGWDSVWECERDGSGNVYIIGGTSPLQLIKYNSTGTLQWTYNTAYDTTEWLGTFATDNAGNSYVTNGSPARIFKINTAGAVVWNNNNPGGLLALTEFWNIAFNCDQTRLVIAGTDGNAFGGPQPYIFDINTNTGNVLTSRKVHNGSLFLPQEVRSITACGNAKYYFLTHDSIGWIHQSLTTCTQSGTNIFHVSNGIRFGYKCEDWRYNNSGIMAIAHYNGFIYVHRGNQLQKRNFQTAAVIATVAIPGGNFVTSFGSSNVTNSGIDIDACGNIYVGSTNAVIKFDQNLTQLASYATTFRVYDVEVNSNGEVIAAGSTGTSSSGARTGTIQSIAASACAPQAIVCCDATICPRSPLCSNSAPVTMEIVTAGGTFSASCGACINATTGVFTPSVAGVGTHTITYTLACGSESITQVVNNCSPLSVCREANNSLTASGSTAPYTWYYWFPGGSTPITNAAQCTACGRTWFFGSCIGGNTCPTPAGWQVLGSGSNIAAPSTYPIRIVSATGDSIVFNTAASIPACGVLLPLVLVDFDAFPAGNRTVQTIWQSQSEQNVDFYEVQRSIDGYVWEPIAIVPSLGNSNNTQYYELKDAAAHRGLSYYRLRQQDNSGQSFYSNIKAVELTDDGGNIDIYPNPTQSAVTIDFGNQPNVEVRIRLYDALGHELKTISTQQGAQYILNISELPAGHYFIKIEKGNNTILRTVEKI